MDFMVLYPFDRIIHSKMRFRGVSSLSLSAEFDKIRIDHKEVIFHLLNSYLFILKYVPPFFFRNFYDLLCAMFSLPLQFLCDVS